MTHLHPITPDLDEAVARIGAKAQGLVALQRLGLPVPPAFVIPVDVCRTLLRSGRLPEGFDDQLAGAVQQLEATTGRRFGGPERPLAVAVRSGAAVSMPGMLRTVLNVGLTRAAVEGLAAETGDGAFAIDARQRLLHALGDAPVPDDAGAQLRAAITSVLRSWDSDRATTYRALHGIPEDLGTAVIVQAMVFGTRGPHSGTGVAFSRDPRTGAPTPSGDLLVGRQGEDVVDGGSATDPLSALAQREPAVWSALLDAMSRVEGHLRDACYLELTYEEGVLWLLQMRPARASGRAAVRIAVDLAEEGVIARDEAVRRVPAALLQPTSRPRLAIGDGTPLLTRGIGASPGVAVGAVATTADAAVRMAGAGPVLLVRPETSPADLRGLAAAAGVLTARGGVASHAAVVARGMGTPAVVGARDLVVDPATRRCTIGGRTVVEGEVLSLDGTGGEVVAGRCPTVDDADDPSLTTLRRWAAADPLP